MPPGASTTRTDWPIRRRTVAPLSATVSVRDLGRLGLQGATGLSEATVTLPVTVRWLAVPAVADPPAQAVSRAAVTTASMLTAARARMLMGPIPF